MWTYCKGFPENMDMITPRVVAMDDRYGQRTIVVNLLRGD